MCEAHRALYVRYIRTHHYFIIINVFPSISFQFHSVYDVYLVLSTKNIMISEKLILIS